MLNPYEKFAPFFSEQSFLKKIGDYFRQAGIKTVYAALLLFYAFKRKETPRWAKNIILGVLGYFLAPLDFLPDLTPLLGYTDDLGVLLFGLTAVAFYIDEDVRLKAGNKLHDWFGLYNPQELADIEGKIADAARRRP
jgi:uncharacterized membrane protein YkvA (DUF1232 family)